MGKRDEMAAQSGKMLVDNNDTELDLGGESEVATIAQSAALSGALDFRARVGMVLHMPAAWTSAKIAFKVASTLTGTYQALYDEYGALVEVTVAANCSYVVPAQKLLGVRYLKLWSENSGVDAVQAAARSITVDQL